MPSTVQLDTCGRRRSPATLPSFRQGRPPRNKGQRYPADPPTVEEIIAVMRAAGENHDAVRLRGLIIVLWRAGLRISEALALTLADVDLDAAVLCIRESKFYKSRLVPIGDNLLRILVPYAARRRQQHAGAASPFFVSRGGTAVTRQNAEMAFCRLRVRANVVCEGADARHQPRLHDMRHAFAVHRLVSWYRDGADVQRLLPKLSTYLGHVHIGGTQRYLTLTPELLRQAGLRFERYAMEPSHE
jgi:integrase/recombinase XerD